MTKAAVVLLCAALCSAATAGQDASHYGTDSVSFQALQTEGVLQGCSLVYMASASDTAYRNGKPVFVVGNLTVIVRDASAIMSLKIGLSDVTQDGAHFSKPDYAYLQTENVTTARSGPKTEDLDERFKLFIFNFDDTAMKLLLEMIETNKLTIGYNRTSGGLDVLVPIDLTVSSTRYNSDGNAQRSHSVEATRGFASCMMRLLDQVVPSGAK